MGDLLLKGIKYELSILEKEKDKLIKVIYDLCIDNKIDVSLIIKENGTEEN